MNKNMNAEIAVVGGGLTGSILALALAKFGFHICVIEKINYIWELFTFPICQKYYK